jgi:hypothetical protein
MCNKLMFLLGVLPQKPAAAKPKEVNKIESIDLSAFAPESTSGTAKWICLACLLGIFTRHLGLRALIPCVVS